MSTYGLYRLSAKVRYFYTQNVMRVSGERERESYRIVMWESRFNDDFLRAVICKLAIDQ